jgi:hypothetical protein
MSQNQLRRAVVAVLLLGLSVASLPVQAWSPVRGQAPAVADLGEGTGFLGNLWKLVAGLLGVQEKEGVTIDPDGAKAGADGDEGVTIDPNGAQGDEGVLIDPDGAK